MSQFDRNLLLQARLTRKQFLSVAALAIASLLGITGILEELKSHAATAHLSSEPETGTLAGATTVTDAAASGGNAIKFAALPTVTRRSWLSGYTGDLKPAGRLAWQTAITAPQVTNTYMDYESDWPQRATDIGYNLPNWLTANSNNSSVNVLTIGLILLASSGNRVAPNMSALAAAATGADSNFISGFTAIGKKLQSIGMDSPSTVIRLGHEMNGNWYPWGTKDPDAAKHAINAANYAAAYRRAVSAIRTICPKIRFSICYNCGYWPVQDLLAHYPGDDYVDIISTDFYDDRVGGNSGTTITSSPISFPVFMDFAHSHGKLFAVEEWGINGNDTTQASRDNPDFVQNIWNALELMEATYPGIVSHDVYFNHSPHFFIVPTSDNPQSAALYKKLWSSS